ncbi:MAG: PQQ-dependent sugar dehydrogenase [Actinomycetota bacterium]
MRARAIAIVVSLGILVVAAPTASEAIPRGTRVQTYRGGLAFPVDMAWVPGTRKIFFTEKNTGKVRVMLGRRLLGRACVNLDVQSEGEQGALGIALHPRFKRNHHLYVYYTNASPRENRVTRFTVRNNRCRARNHILRNIPASSGYHNGGQLEFVGSKLFVSVGENHRAGEAQDRTNRLGKILRVNPNGSIPSNNPFGNAVWSYGHRNPFGLAHRPGTRRLYSSENGPSCDDELNRIARGRNYGWGAGYDCGTRGVGPNAKRPMKRWTPVIVPTDLWWYRGRMKALSGSLYMGDFQGRLHRLVLNRKGTAVRRDRIIHSGNSIVDVSEGPGGWLYFMTPSSIRRIVR